jgi:hypothetical protein
LCGFSVWALSKQATTVWFTIQSQTFESYLIIVVYENHLMTYLFYLTALVTS